MCSVHNEIQPHKAISFTCTFVIHRYRELNINHGYNIRDQYELNGSDVEGSAALLHSLATYCTTFQNIQTLKQS
ncbi:hypothetical protein T10_373 [Trichinella papuae]|uniref:Uncharacterized protein n=1 Tax=Trichinella papuae TaxID=268474 RepID=A0A0V1MVT5_9BILA|nr:hypothetical protein T10_373 [Trichinella papuae]